MAGRRTGKGDPSAGTESVLRQLVTEGPTPQRFLAALPAILVVVAALAVFRVSVTVPLSAYDNPDWYNARELASQSTSMHVDGAWSRMVTAVGSLSQRHLTSHVATRITRPWPHPPTIAGTTGGGRFPPVWETAVQPIS
ncbi:hypothetical protein [Kutzneria sp. NPDC051319]|uniref:hypothetical protein n=1 Tax=Kutzneria sp. NPDC051319 TaxID=3155047 RepID=UPI00342C477F